MKCRRFTVGMAKHAIAIILCVIFLTPFAIILLGSMKTGSEAKLMRLTLPSGGIQWENFAKVIERGNLVRSFFNSALYSVFGTLGAVIFGAMGAFVLSRRHGRLTRAIYFFLVMGIVLPINMAALMQVMGQLKLLNRQHGVILLYIAVNLPVSLFIVHGFVATVPRELDEAALIDGARPVRMFASVILPLLRPVLVTMVLLSFTGIWNDFQIPLYILNTSRNWPMTLSIYNFYGMYENDWNYIFADIVMTCLPALIVYMLAQKQIISGLMSGAVKG